MANQESVIFIEEALICGEVLSKQRLESPIAIAGGGEAEAAEDASGIGIDDEYWPIGSIEDYGVGSLLADAMNREKLLAKLGGIKSKKPSQVAAILAVESLREGFNLQCLGVIVATGADKTG